ncbi:hypothetical protein MHYP_G00107310 [Metynnis hypsauchen]
MSRHPRHLAAGMQSSQGPLGMFLHHLMLLCSPCNLHGFSLAIFSATESRCTASSIKLCHPISDIEPRLAVPLGIFHQALSSFPGVRSGIADGIE